MFQCESAERLVTRWIDILQEFENAAQVPDKSRDHQRFRRRERHNVALRPQQRFDFVSRPIEVIHGQWNARSDQFVVGMFGQLLDRHIRDQVGRNGVVEIRHIQKLVAANHDEALLKQIPIQNIQGLCGRVLATVVVVEGTGRHVVEVQGQPRGVGKQHQDVGPGRVAEIETQLLRSLAFVSIVHQKLGDHFLWNLGTVGGHHGATGINGRLHLCGRHGLGLGGSAPGAKRGRTWVGLVVVLGEFWPQLCLPSAFLFRSQNSQNLLVTLLLHLFAAFTHLGEGCHPLFPRHVARHVAHAFEHSFPLFVRRLDENLDLITLLRRQLHIVGNIVLPQRRHPTRLKVQLLDTSELLLRDNLFQFGLRLRSLHVAKLLHFRADNFSLLLRRLAAPGEQFLHLRTRCPGTLAHFLQLLLLLFGDLQVLLNRLVGQHAQCAATSPASASEPAAEPTKAASASSWAASATRLRFGLLHTSCQSKYQDDP